MPVVVDATEQEWRLSRDCTDGDSGGGALPKPLNPKPVAVVVVVVVVVAAAEEESSLRRPEARSRESVKAIRLGFRV